MASVFKVGEMDGSGTISSSDFTNIGIDVGDTFQYSAKYSFPSDTISNNVFGNYPGAVEDIKLDIDGVVSLSLDEGRAFTQDGSSDIFNNQTLASDLSGTLPTLDGEEFSSFAQDSLGGNPLSNDTLEESILNINKFSGNEFTISYQGREIQGKFNNINGDVNVVPSPSAAALIGITLAVAALSRKTRSLGDRLNKVQHSQSEPQRPGSDLA